MRSLLGKRKFKEMAKGRSEFSFRVHEATKAEEVIQNWLKKNKFAEKEDKKGDKFYLSKSLWTGNKYFDYGINGVEVTVYAWTHGLAGDFDLSTQASQSTAKPFKKKLNELFAELEQV